jgi:hypothetical protein
MSGRADLTDSVVEYGPSKRAVTVLLGVTVLEALRLKV